MIVLSGTATLDGLKQRPSFKTADPTELQEIFEFLSNQPYLAFGSSSLLDFLDQLIVSIDSLKIKFFRRGDEIRNSQIARLLLNDSFDRETINSLKDDIRDRGSFIGELTERRLDLLLSILVDQSKIEGFYSTVLNYDTFPKPERLKLFLDHAGIDTLIELKPGVFLPIQCKAGYKDSRLKRLTVSDEEINFLAQVVPNIYEYLSCHNGEWQLNTKRNIPQLNHLVLSTIVKLVEHFPNNLEEWQSEYPLIVLDKDIESYSNEELLYKLINSGILELEYEASWLERVNFDGDFDSNHLLSNPVGQDASYKDIGRRPDLVDKLTSARQRLLENALEDSKIDRVLASLGLDYGSLEEELPDGKSLREWIFRICDDKCISPEDKEVLAKCGQVREYGHFSHVNVDKLRNSLAFALAADQFDSVAELEILNVYPLKLREHETQDRKISSRGFEHLLKHVNQGKNLHYSSLGFTHLLRLEDQNPYLSNQYYAVAVNRKTGSKVKKLHLSDKQVQHLIQNQQSLRPYIRPVGNELHRLDYRLNGESSLIRFKGITNISSMADAVEEKLEKFLDKHDDLELSCDALTEAEAHTDIGEERLLALYRKGYIEPIPIS